MGTRGTTTTQWTRQWSRDEWFSPRRGRDQEQQKPRPRGPAGRRRYVRARRRHGVRRQRWKRRYRFWCAGWFHAGCAERWGVDGVGGFDAVGCCEVVSAEESVGEDGHRDV